MSGNLTALGVKSLTQSGKYGDGEGLYLVISKSLTRSWVLRIQAGRRRRDFGLGSGRFITLSEARKRATETRNAVLAGNEPQASWRVSTALIETPMTFEVAAKACHADAKRTWKNGKHCDQWINTLQTYAFPTLGSVPVASVDAPLVIGALKPVWLVKAETARRVKQRICNVLDWANAHGHRDQEAPMRAIKRGLGPQRAKKRHFARMPFSDLPDFISKLAKKDTIGSAALLFLIHTAARTGEVRGATWEQMNLGTGLWTVPAEQMKARIEHTVPLSRPALALLRELKKGQIGEPNEPIFRSPKGGKLSNMALSKVLKSHYSEAATVHGFRSSFRTWIAETQPLVPNAVAEAALAHTNRNKVEAAYLRTDFLDQRRPLMELWAAFLQGT